MVRGRYKYLFQDIENPRDILRLARIVNGLRITAKMDQFGNPQFMKVLRHRRLAQS